MTVITVPKVSDGTTNTLLVGEKFVTTDHYRTGQQWGENEPWAAGNSWVHTRCANQQPRQDTTYDAASRGQTAPNSGAAGINGTRDPVRAAALYKSSADKGNLWGQYYLAWATELGDGVTKDMNGAIELYRLAAAQGHLTSINRLDQLGQPLR